MKHWHKAYGADPAHSECSLNDSHIMTVVSILSLPVWHVKYGLKNGHSAANVSSSFGLGDHERVTLPLCAPISPSVRHSKNRTHLEDLL